ncbi:hypothetical protein N806_31980 [Rhodococcus sp. P27]|nr:hypothetical protein N806_17125 [Rhodococcus sp. P27]ERB55734.1 hypothetical protein N806_31980 [Rhodococcus sp. P27]
MPAHGGAATILIRGNSSNTLTADGTHLRGSVSTSSRAHLTENASGTIG